MHAVLLTCSPAHLLKALTFSTRLTRLIPLAILVAWQRYALAKFDRPAMLWLCIMAAARCRAGVFYEAPAKTRHRTANWAIAATAWR